MTSLSVLFLGDTVGQPGVEAAAHAIETIRPDVAIVNGENARNGSGLSPRLYKLLRDSGADAVTLGDHAYRDNRIIDFLKEPSEPICRPANMGPHAHGKRSVELETHGGPVRVVTLLGRRYMPPNADDPFATLDALMNEFDGPTLVIVEIHAETTSEKQAMAHHCARAWRDPDGPRVVAVVGTHTHVRTDDARLINGVATITDLGMCGGHDGVIGRTADASIHAFTRPTLVKLAVETAGARASGAMIRIDPVAGAAVAIEPVDLPVVD